ncbi:hypothetical protein C8T65DRAFT_660305 [Cerioporus squamosus]|nr:hypothetical protein C8T65DRAFT_660305 [Cerioporus squamosus]
MQGRNVDLDAIRDSLEKETQRRSDWIQTYPSFLSELWRDGWQVYSLAACEPLRRRDTITGAQRRIQVPTHIPPMQIAQSHETSMQSTPLADRSKLPFPTLRRMIGAIHSCMTMLTSLQMLTVMSTVALPGLPAEVDDPQQLLGTEGRHMSIRHRPRQAPLRREKAENPVAVGTEVGPRRSVQRQHGDRGDTTRTVAFDWEFPAGDHSACGPGTPRKRTSARCSQSHALSVTGRRVLHCLNTGEHLELSCD